MKVKFVPQNVEYEIKAGESVMHVAQDHGLYIKSVCKGVPSCAECRVRVIEGDFNVLPPGTEELSLIGTGYFVDRRRLSCQLKCFGDITVDLAEQLAKQADLSSSGKKQPLNDRVEQSVAIRASDAHGQDENDANEIAPESVQRPTLQTSLQASHQGMHQTADRSTSRPVRRDENASRQGANERRPSQNPNQNQSRNNRPSGPSSSSRGAGAQAQSGPRTADSMTESSAERNAGAGGEAHAGGGSGRRRRRRRGGKGPGGNPGGAGPS